MFRVSEFMPEYNTWRQPSNGWILRRPRGASARRLTTTTTTTTTTGAMAFVSAATTTVITRAVSMRRVARARGSTAARAMSANGDNRRARDAFRPSTTPPSLLRDAKDDDECEVESRVDVRVDNETKKSAGRSVVALRARSVPGLMRSVAWVLNGMDLVAHECSIATDAEGTVEMTFEVTERVGSSGTEERMIEDPALTRGRLYDYLARCAAGSDETDEERLSEDGVTVDNTRNADSTYVSVRIDDRVSSAISLYPIGNAFTGSGLVVKNGVLTKGVDPVTGLPIKTWEFDVVRQKDRKKLHKDQLQALMYTLALVCSPSSFGRSHAFTSR